MKSVKDHRGIEFPVSGPFRLKSDRPTRSKTDKKWRHSVIETADTAGVGLLFVALGFSLGYPWLQWFFRTRIHFVLWLTLWTLGTVAALWSIPHELRHLAVRRRRTRCRCVACGYSLARLPKEPDDCTVCPECGAAWRFARPKKSKNPSLP